MHGKRRKIREKGNLRKEKTSGSLLKNQKEKKRKMMEEAKEKKKKIIQEYKNRRESAPVYSYDEINDNYYPRWLFED